jgi:hypothetical protein
MNDVTHRCLPFVCCPAESFGERVRADPGS